MKLHLSSTKIPSISAFEELVGMPVSEIKLGFITNASDNRPDRDERLHRFDKLLSGLGFQNVERVDLREHTAVTLRNTLKRFDAVHALGGDVFALREAMRASGFDDIIRNLLDDGLVYSGDSSGALVVGPSLAGFEATNQRVARASLDGVGLVDVIIVPHNDSKQDKYYNRWPTIQAANPGREVLPLNDNHAYIVNGESHRVIVA